MIQSGKFTKLYLEQIIETLSEVRTTLNQNSAEWQLGVNLLKIITKARICLNACADILSTKRWNEISEDNQMKGISEQLIANLGMLIKGFKNSDMHMFFHRQVIFKYGRQELLNIINRNSWLALDIEGNKEKVNFLTYLIEIIRIAICQKNQIVTYLIIYLFVSRCTF